MMTAPQNAASTAEACFLLVSDAVGAAGDLAETYHDDGRAMKDDLHRVEAPATVMVPRVEGVAFDKEVEGEADVADTHFGIKVRFGFTASLISEHDDRAVYAVKVSDKFFSAIPLRK